MMNQGSAEISVSGHLTADHRHLDDLFDQARTLVAAGDLGAARSIFERLVSGLRHHIAVEEKFLFPAFDARVAVPGPTTVMRHEHRKIEQLMASASAALESGDADGFAGEASELAAILHAHNLKEERVLYPRTDAALDDAERAELVAALERG
jgi:hemerythrin superfamily protein